MVGRLSTVMMMVAAMVACHQPELCTTEAVAGVHVVLKDSLSQEPVCDATVTLKATGYQETMIAQPGTPCSYDGAYERPGAYELDVSDAHHHPARKTDVRVDLDDCHVATEQVTLELTPL